jgi:YD repeat-containing protein
MSGPNRSSPPSAGSSSAPTTIARDASGRVTSVTDPAGTTDQIVYGTQGVTSFRENGTTRTITRDSAGRVTGIA